MSVQPSLERLMKHTAILLSLLLACGFAAAKATDCTAPVFPEVSTSDTGVRRVAKEVKAWRSCQLKSVTPENKAELEKQDMEVNAGLEKWMSATVAQSNSQMISKRVISRLEADRRKYEIDRARERVK
jgi:hypothetical protein